jgi:hypothetical protein
MALIIACQATLAMSAGLPPEPDTPETLEGNAADWVAKEYAAGREVAYGTDIPLPGNFKVDYDMIHGAKLWAEALGYGAVYDTTVVAERIHPTAVYGPPDGYVWNPIDGLIRLGDYKYGFGVVELVTVDENGQWIINWQLLAYLAGILDTLEINDEYVRVELIIVQPRAYHPEGPVRRIMIPATSIRAQVNEAFNKVHKAMKPFEAIPLGPMPEATTGPHCIYCPARGICKTYQAATTKVVEYVGQMGRIAMGPADIGVELAILQHAAQFLRGRINALETQAESYLRGGERVPLFCMEQEGGGYKWNDGVTVQELDALAATCGLSLRNNITDPHSRKSPVVTPTQATKAGIDEAVINAYASRTSGGLKLARIANEKIRRIFGTTETPQV